jgi:hypothetical protein
MVASINEPTKELINQELLLFLKYQVDEKDIKCPLEWCRKHETMFQMLVFKLDIY